MWSLSPFWAVDGPCILGSVHLVVYGIIGNYIKLLKPSPVFFPQLQSPAATQQRFAFPFPRRFSLLLASGALAGVGGGGDLAESAEDLYNPY